MNHFVYILECGDGTYYTGYTNNITARMKKHEKGKGAKYTRGRTPLNLVYHKGFETKEDALKAEYRIKQLTRQEKIRLILEGSIMKNANSKELS